MSKSAKGRSDPPPRAAVQNVSEPLRAEAERRWADASKTSERRTRRRVAKAKALTRRRDTTDALRKEISGLKAKLRRAEQSLERKRREQGDAR
jgi:hypothetical protein